MERISHLDIDERRSCEKQEEPEIAENILHFRFGAKMFGAPISPNRIIGRVYLLGNGA